MKSIFEDHFYDIDGTRRTDQDISERIQNAIYLLMEDLEVQGKKPEFLAVNAEDFKVMREFLDKPILDTVNQMSMLRTGRLALFGSKWELRVVLDRKSEIPTCYTEEDFPDDILTDKADELKLRQNQDKGLTQ